jgi:hypothetical protein
MRCIMVRATTDRTYDSGPYYLRLFTTINNVFFQLNKWYDDNLLLFKLWKNPMSILLFKVLFFRKHLLANNNNFISNSTSTKFLGVIIGNISWKAHIDHLLPKLCMACYSVRTIKPFMCQENLNSIYYFIPWWPME